MAYPWNSIWPFGTIYIFSTIFTIIGIIIAIKHRKEIQYGYFMGIWLIVALLLSFICEPNINRLNIIFFPIIFYTVIGIEEVAKQGKAFAISLLIIYILSFGLFLNTYFKEDANTYKTFEDNLEEPIKYVNSLEGKRNIHNKFNKRNHISMCYFYTKYNTNDFVNTVIDIRIEKHLDK